MDERLRRRLLAAGLLAALAWLVWAERRDAARSLAELGRQAAAAARSGAAARAAAERQGRLVRVTERLAERIPAPTSAARLRNRLLGAARDHGVELSAARLQPLLRPPAGTAGSEARISAFGDPAALGRFLAALEGRGWPLRIESAGISVRAGIGTLTASLTVLWPSPPEASFTAAQVAELAGDPRLEALLAWLDTPEIARPPRPRAEEVARTAAPETPAPVRVSAEAATAALPAGEETPDLTGFVHLGGDAPVQAALSYRGETLLVSAGERIGEFTVVEITPPDAVLLARPGTSPLRLTLR